MVCLVVFGSVTGCSFDPLVSGSDVCFSSADCLDGKVCSSDGLCVDPDRTDDDMSVGEDDGNDLIDVVDMGDDLDPNACTEDKDEDGYGIGPNCPPARTDCNDNDNQIYPGAPTRCNGLDNNCDNQADTEDCECTAGFMRACGSDVGTCRPGTQLCVEGQWGECTGSIQPGPEVCDGFDNNCNGTTDEGCPCTLGATKPCGTDVGECQPGTQECVAGRWSECNNSVLPTEEICDGKDNDCDGIDDNNTTDTGNACSTGEAGACALGQQTCESGVNVCKRVNDPQPETCNGADDDCVDGVDNGVTQSCNTACGAGTQSCTGGSFGACVPDNPPQEICNGMDDNCDSQTDESFPEDGMSCDTGLSGNCAAGVRVCTMGGLGCEPVNAAQAETCDGTDNDCDGLIDEDAQGLALTEQCGTTCPTRSVRVCENGAWSTCDRGELEVCNGQDSNCDSAADNQAVCLRVCGNQLVPGTLDCATNACDLPDEICGDGIDNDCDGSIDTGCNADLEEMVYIPGGTFYMGAAPGDMQAGADESPLHIVEIDPFYADQYEVSRADYAACILAGTCSLLDVSCPLQPTVTQGNKPIVCVSLQQAETYCQWASKRLPTEAEWEKVARGPFPRLNRWPWGNTPDASRGVFNCGQATNDCVDEVDTFANGASYYGARHMAGNAAEFTSDFYAANFYTTMFVTNPIQTTDLGVGRTIRGGAYSQSSEFGRVSNRAVTQFLNPGDIGFRCVKD